MKQPCPACKHVYAKAHGYGFAEYLHPSENEWTAGYVTRTNGNTAPWLDKAKEELGFDF